MRHKFYKLLLAGCFFGWGWKAQAQTNSVVFGKNRLQYKLFHWRFYQTQNFNTYFSQGGLQQGKFVAQAAEEELPAMEKFLDYTVNRRINIVVYNSYADMKQSNIGIGIDWQSTGGITKLVDNKMIVYFDGNHDKLREQIREGLAKVLLQNMLFGDDLGQFASNAVLLNLPAWFTDGFVAYAAEPWSVDLDNELRELLFTGRYTTFNQLAQEHPTLAGHAFWFYIQSKYGKDATSYFLYIARIQRSIKKASEQVLHENFKNVLRDLQLYYNRTYQMDNRGRRQYTRGTPVVTLFNDKSEHYRIHPNPRDRNYAMVQFQHGLYKVLLYQGFYTPTVLLKSGVRQMKAQVNPDYPLLAWDPKGNRLAIIYQQKGRPKLMIYDLVNRIRTYIKLPTDWQSVNSFQYMLDYNTLVLSVVKDGHSDIYTYNISTFKATPITQDPYDDLDPSYVAFPHKSGIIFTSNRPGPDAPLGDTAMPRGHFNVFLIDNWNTTRDKQITQLTHLTRGNARFPMQYNDTYFTFVGNQNGIDNRYAGFFSSKAAGLDTLDFIGQDILRNPGKADLDSALAAYGSQKPDSVRLVELTQDSTYVFPITNYIHGITESYSAGDKQVASETLRQGNLTRVYKLKVDEQALRRRNISTPLTQFRKYQAHEDSVAKGLPEYFESGGKDTTRQSNFFQSQFGYQAPDTSNSNPSAAAAVPGVPDYLSHARVYPYHLRFSTDYLVTQLDNSVLFTRYQPFTGGGGPIYLQQPFNGLIRIGVSDLFEDIKFNGGFRFPSTFDGSEYFFTFENLRHFVDWKLTYYRKVDRISYYSSSIGNLPGKMKTNIFQANATIPFDAVRSVRLTLGYRTDHTFPLAEGPATLPKGVLDSTTNAGIFRAEYVYDNTINPAINIWKGLRYKIYAEMFPQLNANKNSFGKAFTFNAGFDARYYLPIYKNFIWATRLAGDFSWGTKKVLYYLGGVDNWLFPKYDNQVQVHPDESYAYQTLAENLRGYDQNIKNGNNVVLLNTELRLPVFATFVDQPINSDFIRNFQVTSFADVGTAWNQKLSFKNDAYATYVDNPNNPSVYLQIKNNFLGPFAGGYGFGARTTLGGYFLRLDAAWPMSGFFRGKPIWYLALGVDF